ncbi:MAG: hypothetical protein IKI29_05880 [Clostridia bacterium]|nr:hypothetical protein [Clostridia bacterium]
MTEKEKLEQYGATLLELYSIDNFPPGVAADAPPVQPASEPNESFGELAVNVTTMRGMYPVKGALVTIYTDQGENRTVWYTATTDQSGQTPAFRLPTPAKALSESSGQSDQPYALYNTSVKADGFIEQINRDVMVFSGVKSVQDVDLMMRSANGKEEAPRIYNQSDCYDL